MMQRVYKLTAAAAIMVMALATLSYAAGARINTTRSIPIGLYWVSDTEAGIGAYVRFCPPDIDAMAMAKQRGYISAGFCPGDYGYAMKLISAVAGDTVTIDSGGVTVNGRLLPFSRPRAVDAAGRPLPELRANYTLEADQVLLMSDISNTSFDGRYYGPVNRAQIEAVIKPVITWCLFVCFNPHPRKGTTYKSIAYETIHC